MTKLYCKAYELREHLKKGKRKQNGIEEDQANYIEKLIEYCEEQGVVREEHSLRQSLLKRHQLQFYGLVKESNFIQHTQDIENAMKTIHINHDEHISIAEQLIESGAVETMRQANTTMSYFTMWQHGADLKDLLKQSQYYQQLLAGRYPTSVARQ